MTSRVESLLTVSNIHIFPLQIFLGIRNVPVVGSIPFQFHWPDTILNN